MAIKAEFKVNGLEALQQRLNEKKENLRRVLDMRLMQLAEEAVTHAKVNKGYQDRTANLKNSISYALFYDGRLISRNEGTITETEQHVQQDVSDALEQYSQQEGVVSLTGYSLIIVAGMNYGVYVEHKGYNVLYLTKYFLRDELRKILEETIEDIKND